MDFGNGVFAFARRTTADDEFVGMGRAVEGFDGFETKTGVTYRRSVGTW